MALPKDDEVVVPSVVQAAWGSSDDDEGPINLFLKVKHWFKCPIFLRNWYECKHNVLFYNENFIEL
jgi:hypothetical protein